MFENVSVREPLFEQSLNIPCLPETIDAVRPLLLRQPFRQLGRMHHEILSSVYKQTIQACPFIPAIGKCELDPRNMGRLIPSDQRTRRQAGVLLTHSGKPRAFPVLVVGC